MVRLNITLPDEIAGKLARKRNKSRFIAEVLKERFASEIRKELEKDLIAGYKSARKEDSNLNSEWEKTGLEKWD